MMRRRLVTIFGYPAALRRGGKRSFRQRGIALLLAILIIAVAMMFATDMIVNSQVNMELAAKNRDNIRAEFMARSAINMATFLLTADYGMDWFLRSERSPMPTEPKDGPSDLWGMLNGIPLGGDTVELLAAVQESFGLNAVNDEETIAMFKLFEGNFVMNVSDESSKININMCAQGHCIRTLAMLEALLTCPIERAFLENKGLSEVDLVNRVRDWVSRRGSSDQDEPYQRRNPPHNAKHGPFYSLEELRLVEGWDEEVYTVFAPYLTVFPYQEQATDKPAVNLNTASQALLTCLLPKANLDCRENFAVQVHNASQDKMDLATDEGSIQEVLRNTFCTQRATGDEAGDRDPTTWFTVRSDTFRIDVTGQVGDQVRRMRVILERRMPDVSKKELISYKILDWKVL